MYFVNLKILPKSKRSIRVSNQLSSMKYLPKSKRSIRVSNQLSSMKYLPDSKRSIRVSNQLSSMKYLPDSKRSQAWGIDLIIGVIIFSVGVLVFFVYSVNNAGESRESMEGLSHEGDILFSNILSEGYPQDWDENNVIKIGILGRNRINETKLERFYNLANNDYAKTKSIFNTRYDYYFSFSNMTINSVAVDGIGKPGINLNNITANNLLKTTRFSIYKDKPTAVYLYIWEE